MGRLEMELGSPLRLQGESFGFLSSLLQPMSRSRRESITGPNETITANDAVDGIRRVAFARENSSQVDTPSKPKHTFKSRWQKVKTVIGVANKKLSTGMYEGCLDSNDFQR